MARSLICGKSTSLTFGSAKELKQEELRACTGSEKEISVTLKSEIQGLGNVNVNAIEDYQGADRSAIPSLTTQHEDPVKGRGSADEDHRRAG